MRFRHFDRFDRVCMVLPDKLCRRVLCKRLFATRRKKSKVREIYGPRASKPVISR